MTVSYKHRFARTFHQISRDHPDLPLGTRFSMANLQLREQRLAALIAELESFRLARSELTPATKDAWSPLVAKPAVRVGGTAEPVAASQGSDLVPAQSQWSTRATTDLRAFAVSGSRIDSRSIGKLPEGNV